MLVVFVASFISGIILGAPVGVSGALAANAILINNARLLRNIIIASISGESILAFAASFSAGSMNGFVEEHKVKFYIATGAIAFIMGMVSLVTTYKSHKGIASDELKKGKVKWLLEHTGPPLAAFLSNLIHPGNILVFLATVATLSVKISDFNTYYYIFGIGIFTGSGTIFTISAIIFWKNREKADKFVHHFRYALSMIICAIGLYLMLGKSMYK